MCAKKIISELNFFCINYDLRKYGLPITDAEAMEEMIKIIEECVKNNVKLEPKTDIRL